MALAKKWGEKKGHSAVTKAVTWEYTISIHKRILIAWLQETCSLGTQRNLGIRHEGDGDSRSLLVCAKCLEDAQLKSVVSFRCDDLRIRKEGVKQIQETHLRLVGPHYLVNARMWLQISCCSEILLGLSLEHTLPSSEEGQQPGGAAF
ncbi:hypothetical protein TREES_T100006272 [Tupaia chinensis]|uniref:Uncharacterized protein n=1 Tax=Tupaia chinensis TaxID=246437 RepID=L9L597_TUPCH|nr:hypothetical protein TREES_T100006272 [Tupaia chinensis]